jgi:hypothetical protein
MSTQYCNKEGDRIAHRYSGGTERGCILEIYIPKEEWDNTLPISESGWTCSPVDIEETANQIWVRIK